MSGEANSLNPLQPSFLKNAGLSSRDFMSIGISVAGLILFIGIGGQVIPQIVRSWFGVAEAPDTMLSTALLLNIALLLLGWRRYAAMSREVAIRRGAEQEAWKLAETDALTGCYNRRSLLPVLDRMIAERAQSHGEVAVMLIDLDNFKSINDRWGHKAGDSVLIEAAARISRVLPKGTLLARMGGDEFACALPYDALDRAMHDELAGNIVSAASQPVETDNLKIDVTVSVGIATSRQPGQETPSAETLVHWADVAMYHAKNGGKDRHAWFEARMESELRFRNALETGLRNGVASGEFVPYYEQQINIQTGELVGFEMLARWKSPEFGLVSPELFIPLAEEMDVIGQLSEGLIRQALKDAKSWDDRLTLSVNISPVQLRDPWLAQKLLLLLQEGGFPPHRFEIEITESCLHENIAVVRAIITSLKNQGVKVSLDDFGTGYSSLAQLRALNFDRLKIDRSFVAELAEAGANSELVAAIVSLGRGLGLPIVVEGIENDEVLKALRDLGDLKGQGYLYGQPEDSEATLQRLMHKAADNFTRPATANEAKAGKSRRKAG